MPISRGTPVDALGHRFTERLRRMRTVDLEPLRAERAPRPARRIMTVMA